MAWDDPYSGQGVVRVEDQGINPSYLSVAEREALWRHNYEASGAGPAPEPDAGWYSGGSSYKPASGYASPGGGEEVVKVREPSVGGPGEASQASQYQYGGGIDPGQATDPGRAGELLFNPEAMASEILRGMGVLGQRNPFAKWLKGSTPAVGTAYMLQHGPNVEESLSGPQDTMRFAEQFLGGGGGGFDYKNAAMGALQQAIEGAQSAAGGGEGNPWSRMIAGSTGPGGQPGLTPESIAAFMQNAYQAGNMGRGFNPLDAYRTDFMGEAPGAFEQQQLMGRAPSTQEFFQWILENWRKYMGEGPR